MFYEQQEICRRKGMSNMLISLCAQKLLLVYSEHMSDVHTLDQLNCFPEEPSGDETVLSLCE